MTSMTQMCVLPVWPSLRVKLAGPLCLYPPIADFIGNPVSLLRIIDLGTGQREAEAGIQA